MILTAHQPLYLGGYLGTISKIHQADVYCSFDCAQYDPNDYQNRNRIRVKTGSQLLTVPVLHKGYQQTGLRIRDVQIDNRQPWRRKHKRSIEQNYSKAPYYEKYEGFFNGLYSRDWQYLTDLNEFILRWALEVLGIEVGFVNSADYDFQGKKSDLVLDMCKTLGASKYMFGCNGRDYADIESFTNAGIEVEFQDYKHPQYKQVYDGFQEYMCVLDLIFNHGKESLAILTGGQG